LDVNRLLHEDIRAVSGDVIQNLRKSLDYTYFEIVSPLVNDERKSKKIQFPFSNCQKNFYRNCELRSADIVSSDFVDTITRARPFKCSDDYFYLVHLLGVDDRHKFPTPIADFRRISGYEIRKQLHHFPEGIISATLSDVGTDFVWYIKPLPFLDERFSDRIEINVPIDVYFVRPDENVRMELVNSLKQMSNEVETTLRSIQRFIPKK